MNVNIQMPLCFVTLFFLFVVCLFLVFFPVFIDYLEYPDLNVGFLILYGLFLWISVVDPSALAIPMITNNFFLLLARWQNSHIYGGRVRGALHPR